MNVDRCPSDRRSGSITLLYNFKDREFHLTSTEIFQFFLQTLAGKEDTTLHCTQGKI